jgi:hypothetical protein
MTAVKHDLRVEQGTDFSDLTYWKTGATAASAQLVNLTGWTARMQIRASLTSPTVLESLTTENGGIVLGGTAGSIEIKLTNAQTTAITWSRAVYDLELISSGGLVRRHFYGVVSVSPEVTRV